MQAVRWPSVLHSEKGGVEEVVPRPLVNATTKSFTISCPLPRPGPPAAAHQVQGMLQSREERVCLSAALLAARSLMPRSSADPYSYRYAAGGSCFSGELSHQGTMCLYPD